MVDSQNPFKEKETIEENIEETKEENAKKAEDETEDKDKQKEDKKEETKDEYKKKYEDLNNKYLRLAADFDNFRKRTQSEKEELIKFANCEMLKKITTVIDTFERAEEHLKDIEDFKVIKESYEVAIKQFSDTLNKIGLEEISCLGEKFDPNEHEAITQIPTDEYEPDCIASVMQKGYKYEDKIVRPALVGVAVKKD